MLLILHNRFILTYTIHTRQVSAKFGHRSRTEIKNVMITSAPSLCGYFLTLIITRANYRSQKYLFKGIIVCWDLAVEYFSCVKVIFI